MTDRIRNIVVGLTALAGLVGLMYMMLLFGYVPRWVQGGYRVTIELPHAGGIGEGTLVYLQGIEVGRVRSVELMDPPTRGVVATVVIDDDRHLSEGVRAVVNQPFFTGSASLTLDLSQVPPDAKPLPTDGSAVIPGGVPDGAAGLLGDVGAAFAEPVAQLNRLADSLEQLSGQWTEVGRNINLLVEPRSTDDVDNGKATGNLATVVVRADHRLTELRTVLDGMNQWVNDTQLRDDIRAAASNARSLTRKLDENIDGLTRRYFAVADDLSKAIGSMQKLLDQTHEGKGTIGKLLNDPALYNNLNDAAQRVGGVLDELKLLIEKWKAEGLPVQF